MLPRSVVLSLSIMGLACGDKAGETNDGATSSSETSTSAGVSTSGTSSSSPTSGGVGSSETTAAPTGGGEEDVAGLEMLPRFAGLWSGPATMTPLGSFPQMNMDVRAASDRVLFSRADLDEANSLRFAFEIEAPGDAPTLVYRNGGYFLGLLRDSRAALVEATDNSWRFCSTLPAGCDYIDATFTLSGETDLVFDARVKGQQHVYWAAKRKEVRELAEPFPADEAPLDEGAPFPEMPTLEIDVTWSEPLMVDGEVWVILSTTDCDLQLSCTASRSLRKVVLMDATSASLTIEQIHAGDYKLNAILDRNGNFATTQFPDSGDGLGVLNKKITVKAEGATQAATSIFLTL